MSPKNSLLTVGLTALGLLGYSATRAVYSGDAPAPPGLPSAPAAATPSHSVLLLSDGRVIQGDISETEDVYILRQNGGEIRFRKGQVEERFRSVAEAYEYKRASIPARDPDEHLKLARWCLVNHLPDQARAELHVVAKLSPDSRVVAGMLAALDADDARRVARARPRTDPGLIQTGAEMTDATNPRTIADGMPAELNANDLRAQRHAGISGLPVIFDLPPGLALQRAEQFAQSVHPILQASCAGCHNEKYPGDFRLLQARSRRDLTTVLLRANLDATLRLIDPDNPANSELFSRSLVPHGSKTQKQAMFTGANDRRFQAIVSWVNSLRTRPKTVSDVVIPTRLGESTVQGSSGFATERPEGAPVSSVASSTDTSGRVGYPPPTAAAPRVLPAARYVPGRGMVAEDGPPAPDEFPTPYPVGGAGSLPSTLAPGGGNPAVNALPPLPGQSPAAGPATANSTNAPAKPAAKSSKPVKIDPQLLEKALLNRNQNR